jgi:hypothetical protein
MNSEDTALKALLELLNALEAGVSSARQIIMEAVSDWDPERIKWHETTGPSGPFQKSDDANNPEFKAMLKDLQAHNGKMTRERLVLLGFQEWSHRRPQKEVSSRLRVNVG